MGAQANKLGSEMQTMQDFRVKASVHVLVAFVLVAFGAWWLDQYLAQAAACEAATNGRGRLATTHLMRS